MTLLKICVLRANPQDLPTSTGLTVLALATYGVTDVAAGLARVSLPPALEAAALDTLVLAALAHAALKLRRLEPRLRQTLTALAGCGAALAIPLLLASAWTGPELALEIWLPATLWLIGVYGHILRHAFDVGYGFGVAAACVYIYLSLVVTAPFLATPAAN